MAAVGKRKAGRPSKKTDARVAILIEALEAYMPIDMACHYAQIDAATFWRWCQKDTDFARRINFARSAAIRGLIGMVVKTDPSGAWKVLKSIDKRNFGENSAQPNDESPKELHDYDDEETKLLEAASKDE